jgi:hemerythrin-like domain-containing protein
MSRSVGVGVSFPGLRSPGVGFEAPFEMLTACHERVERMLDLLSRLQAHLMAQGCDEQARSAAADVLRYFDLAAPQHHLDEERHVFPAVLALQEPQLRQLVERLQCEHLEMESLWALVRQTLQHVTHADAQSWTPLSDADKAVMVAFAAIYQGHIRDEESLVYPAAQQVLAKDQLNAMSSEMTRRRNTVVYSGRR